MLKPLTHKTFLSKSLVVYLTFVNTETLLDPMLNRVALVYS